MKRWEYCEATWQPAQVVVTFGYRDDSPSVETFDSVDWPQILAQLGSDGWELVSTMASPVGEHEFYFYFKRPLID